MASAALERRKKQHKCTRCAKNAPLGQGVCFDCADKMKAARDAILAQGLCTHCWHAPAVPGRRLCETCRVRSNHQKQAREQARKQAGLCVQCGKYPQHLGHHIYCATCWEKRMGF